MSDTPTPRLRIQAAHRLAQRDITNALDRGDIQAEGLTRKGAKVAVGKVTPRGDAYLDMRPLDRLLGRTIAKVRIVHTPSGATWEEFAVGTPGASRVVVRDALRLEFEFRGNWAT